jgi:uncharacterized membrane protein
MSEIAKKILEKVKKEGIEKIPRWHFVFKRIFIWGSLIVAVILGSFAVSMMMFQLINMDWDLLPRVMPGPGFGFFRVLPYFWLLVSILLFIFVYFDFKKTRSGHRYGGGLIVGISLLIAIVLGAGIYYSKTSEFADDAFLRSPIYMNMHPGRGMLWNDPENGIIDGVILEVTVNTAIVMEDVIKHVWNVDITEAKIGRGPKDWHILVGDRVRAVGEVTGVGEFSAEEIRPLMFPGPPR